jgi:predicted amidohydrolase
MPTSSFQLGMGQMLVEGGRIADNLSRAVEMIAQASAAGCQIAVLPECLDIGWTHPSARELAQPIPGRISDRLVTAARNQQIYVVAGLTERQDEHIYNTAILIDPNGQILLKHRKINILDIAQDLYATGDRLGVAGTGLGTIGIDICADNFYDSLCLGHALARMGARAILSPSAWAVPADHDQQADPYGGLWIDAYTELARLYDMPVIGVSNVGPITAGPWAGRKCIGCSLAVGRDARILAQAPYGIDAECLTVVELDLSARHPTGTDIAPMLREKGYQGP